MSMIIFIIGLLPLCIVGYLAVRVLESKHPVLTALERITFGAVLGPTLTTFLIFLGSAAGFIPLTMLGMGSVIAALLIALVAVLFVQKVSFFPRHHIHLPACGALPAWVSVLLWVLCGWTVLKIIAAMTM